MTLTSRQLGARFRALLLLLLLALGWASAPATLLAAESDVCETECCMAMGHCCCDGHKVFVKGQDLSDVYEVGAATIQSACPCLQPASVNAKLLARQAAPPRPHYLAPEQHQLPNHGDGASHYLSPHFRPNSSRAPPAILL